MTSPTKIAVIGGGIAGVAAAWALHKSGFSVQLFEKGSGLGGNARAFSWRTAQGPVETSLFVLAWPEDYYHNYNQLLAQLGVAWERIPIRYFINTPRGAFAQDPSLPFHRELADDLRKWDKLVQYVSKGNAAFTRSPKGVSARSLYHFSYANPLNFIPLRVLVRAFGISRDFWDLVFVPLHCSTFITAKLNHLPAVIAPLLESIVPLGRATTMATWTGSPGDVFLRMTAGFREHVHTSHEITVVRRRASRFEIEDRAGRRYLADRVVFACDAQAALSALQPATIAQRLMLSGVRYVDDVDPMFRQAIVHNDASVIAAEHRSVVTGGYNTYSEVKPDGSYECSFVLSPKTPALQGRSEQMFVTFNSDKPIKEVQARVSIPRANHCLTLKNMAIMANLRRIQGKGGIYFCGSFTTPEGGHDLSLLSGLVVAKRLGAAYPLDPNNQPAVHDFDLLDRLMMGR